MYYDSTGLTKQQKKDAQDPYKNRFAMHNKLHPDTPILQDPVTGHLSMPYKVRKHVFLPNEEPDTYKEQQEEKFNNPLLRRLDKIRREKNLQQ